MNCQEVEKLLIDSLDAADRPEICEHLLGCPACAELRRQLEEIEGLNRALARVSGAPRGFSGKVASEVSRGRRLRPGWGILFSAAAGVALLAGGLHFSQGYSDSARSLEIETSIDGADLAADDFDFRPSFEAYRQPGQAGISYIEVMVPASGGSYIVRVPSTIQIRRPSPVEAQLTRVSY